MKKPLRMEIYKLLQDGKARAPQDFITEMQYSYKEERQLLAIKEHLQSLRTVGIIAVANEWLQQDDSEEKLIQSWVLTSNGQERLSKLL